jgi:hypothetical protein
MLLKVVTIVVLFGIIYEDFRYRLVKVFLYVLLFAFLLTQRLGELPTKDFLFLAGINLCYLLLLLSVCLLVVYLRHKTWKFIDHFLGLGDVLYLVSIAIWFEPVTFVFFNTASFALALLLHFILRNFSFYRVESVPLAGMQSLFFIPVFIFLAP